MRRTLILLARFILLLTLISLTGCHKSKWIKIDIPMHDSYPEFTIAERKTNAPFILIGDSSANTGPVYFETAAGKTWIRGNPDNIEQNKNFKELTWIMRDRQVWISFRKDSGCYSFTFKAQPEEDILAWGMSIAATHDEYFTGLFERVVDGDQKESWKPGITEAMNLRGQKVEMLVKPTLSLYTPFYLSSNGYGLFIQGTWPGKYDFCNSNPGRVLVSFEGPSLEGIIYTAKNPSDIVKAHSLHVGPTIVPPEWAFLPWRWRDNHSNNTTYYDGTHVNAPYNSMVVEDILMMKAFDIPCGLYWVDRPWAKGPHGYDDFDWDPQRFPRAEEMIAWIHDNNMKFLLWIAPWVAGNMQYEAKQLGYSQPIPASEGGVDSSAVAMLDFTNPEACRWWQENGIEKMLRQGVNGFKLDRAEELVPASRDIILYDGRTSREVRNDYPVLYVKTVNESCRKIYNDDFILIPRAGYTGSSKYSGFWGGDIGVPAEGLRAAIIAVQRSAVIGFPVWGSDIGGYWQGDLDREVCARWLAFGCFNPIMEFGPIDDRAPWDMPTEPHYDTELIAIWRLYAKIHAALADYSHAMVVEAHETGMPVVRPLFLVAPNEEEAWADWPTFMYGSDILVSAIWQKGMTSQKVYLPEGITWHDAWDDGKTYEGGQTIEVQCPLYKIPIFIREHSTIDLGDLDSLYKESCAIAQKVPNLKELEKQMFRPK